MISQTDRERELYESRLKMRRDISYEMTEARTVGLEEGRKVGLAEGRAEGRAEGMAEGLAEGWRAHIRFLQKMLGREVAASEQLQALSAADLESLAARLEAEVSAKRENGS